MNSLSEGTTSCSSARYGRVVAQVGNSQSSDLHLLCDGAASPNPGWMQLIVLDGSQFLPLEAKPLGTNHRAVYEAILAALSVAHERSASSVRISLLSRLVFQQVTTNTYCSHPVLIDYRSQVAAAVGLRQSVVWQLIEPPIRVSPAQLVGVRQFRSRALREIACAGNRQVR